MKNTVFIVLIAILVAAFAFFVGVRVQRRFALGWNYGAPAVGRTFPGVGMNRFGGGKRGMTGGNFRGMVQGQIIKIDNNNVTVQLPNGGTYTITISDQTAVDKTAKVTKADLAAGQNITVFGGSYLNGAQTVIINP